MKKMCAVRTCPNSADRILTWKGRGAGESLLCEEHYKDYRRRFKHLLAKADKKAKKDEESEQKLL